MMLPAFSFAQFPLVSIHDLQYVDDQNLANGIDSALNYVGDTIQVEGVVTFDPCAYGQSTTGSRVGTFLSQKNDSGAWSAIHVLIDPATIGYGSGPSAVAQLSDDVLFQDNFVYGNTVKCTGILSHFSNNTQLLLLPIQSTVTSVSIPVPAPIVLAIDTFEVNDGQGGQNIQIPTGEKYEAVYVEMQNVRVVDVTVTSGGTRINWSIQDNLGNKMKVRDMSGWIRNDTSDNFCTSSGSYTVPPFDTPIVNSVLAYVRGVIIEYKTGAGPYEYWLAPLTLNDIGPTTYAAPTVAYTTLSNPVPSTTQTQTVTASITDDQSVASATLYYAAGLSNNTFTGIAMTNTGGNIWQATIPAQGPDSTYIKYWIKATDNQGYYTNYPDSLGTNKFYLIKNSGITSIQQLQWHPLGFGASPYTGSTIDNMNVQGIVMCESGSLYDLGQVMIQSSNLPWNGIALTGSGMSTLHRGDLVKITKAKVFENNTVTTLDSVTYTVLSSANTLLAAITGISMDSIMASKFNHTEPYESMLLLYNNVYVVNLNPDVPSNFGEWSIYTIAGIPTGLRCDDISNDIGFGFNIDSFTVNQNLSYIYGMLTRSFSNWKLLPRNRDDIAGFEVIYIGVDVINSSSIKIYPNPVSDDLFVSSKNFSAETIATIYDVMGRKLLEQKNSSGNFSLSMKSLSAGTYILHVSDGKNVSRVKVVKVK